jgi:hypothetical protein
MKYNDLKMRKERKRESEEREIEVPAMIIHFPEKGDSEDSQNPVGDLVKLYNKAVQEIEVKRNRGMRIERELLEYCRSLEMHIERKRRHQ